MSQRDSGYERKERDCYETPEWVTQALIPHLPLAGERIRTIWEPAAGSGKMARELARCFKVTGTDIDRGSDFLNRHVTIEADAIITNPPYNLADEFIDRSLALIFLGHCRTVAMLLRTDFDHAAGRRRWFADQSYFTKKVVLTRRIRWFEDSKGSPSFNHAWFIWDWMHEGAPTLAYGP